MTYRSRSSRLQSLTNNDNDSIYWSAFDTFSNVTDRTRSASRQSASLNSRNYIDPWDLENYAYIQRTMESPEPCRIPSPPNSQMLSSSFYYVSNNVPDECPCYAGLDEQLFYNAKYEMIPDDVAYSSYTDVETSSTERNSSCSGGSTVSTLQLHTPGFGVQSRRSIVLPKPMPQIEFPAPPPPLPLQIKAPLMHQQPSSAYEYYANITIPNYESLTPSFMQHHQPPHQHQQQPHHHHHHRRRRMSSKTMQCYDCMDNQMPLYFATSSIEDKRHADQTGYSLYGSTTGIGTVNNGGYATIEQPLRHFERFGLSKNGLLQIDYSCNWNNLQRFIESK